MKETPSIDLATPEDIDQIVALRQTCMPHVQTPRRLVEWQFFKNPLGTANVYVVRSKTGLDSMVATLPRPIRVNGAVRKGRTMVDIMTDPARRGQGLAHRLGFRCWQDMTNDGELAYILPNQNSEKSFRRVGWTELMRVPLRSAQIVKDARRPYRHAYQNVESFGDRATDIWDRCPFAVGVHRDANYLNWRYSKPDCTYHRFLIDNDQGLLVLKFFSEGDKRLVHICELHTAGDQQPLVEDALWYCHDFAVRLGADRLTCWLSKGHMDESIYSAFGFQTEYLERFIFFKPAVAADKILNTVPWHFSQGDSDVY